MRVSELLDLCANDNYEEIDFYDEVNQINDTTTARNIDNGTTEYNWADATVEYWYANFDAGVLQIKATLPYIKSSRRNNPMKRLIRASAEKINCSESLYNRLLAVVDDPETDIDTHESDLYVKITPKTTKILKDYFDEIGVGFQAERFIDQITHKPFYDVPFGYMNEFVEKKRRDPLA